MATKRKAPMGAEAARWEECAFQLRQRADANEETAKTYLLAQNKAVYEYHKTRANAFHEAANDVQSFTARAGQ